MKNYIFLLLGITYFGFYFYAKDNSVFELVRENFKYGNELLSYIAAFFGIFTSIGILGIIIKQVEKIITNIFSKTKSKYDDILGEFIVKFFNISKYIIAIFIGLNIAIIPLIAKNITDKVFYISFIFALLILSSSLVNSTFKILAKTQKSLELSKDIFPIVKKILIVFIWIVGGITIISNLGYNVSALITGAGVGGLALALAAQKSVSNIFGAISIIVNKPFKVGDFIRVNNFTGSVNEIGLIYLVLTDITGNRILIPNENLISAPVENLTLRVNRRTDFTIGVIYGTSLEKLKKAIQIIEDILEKYVVDQTIDSYRVHFDSFGDFSLNINGTYFSLINNDYKRYLKQKEEINLEIKKQFEKSKIEIAFPTQEIIIKKQEN
ncbi:MAG: mechanosensitive ion channel family protein [Candidatus Gracilibacteria bacterium]|nr:mechanosensitive ion channel family protein [Candidatus Gracilibacteria bacterium]